MDDLISTRVVFFCRSFVAEGCVALAEGARLTDFMLSPRRRIAVADVVVKVCPEGSGFAPNF
jgi:hypothetical protein